MSSSKPERTALDYFIYSAVVLVVGIIALPILAIAGLASAFTQNSNGVVQYLFVSSLLVVMAAISIWLYVKGANLLSPRKRKITLIAPIILALVVFAVWRLVAWYQFNSYRFHQATPVENMEFSVPPS